MSRVPRTVFDPKEPLAVSEHLARVQRVVDGDVEFGSPQDPRDPASNLRADGIQHNGTLQNMKGSWVELNIADGGLLNTNLACVHNLGAAVLSATQPNVRWLVFGWQHDGTGAGAGSTLSVLYVDGAVTADSIELRFLAPTRTVSGTHALKVCLFFISAVHGIAEDLPS